MTQEKLTPEQEDQKKRLNAYLEGKKKLMEEHEIGERAFINTYGVDIEYVDLRQLKDKAEKKDEKEK